MAPPKMIKLCDIPAVVKKITGQEITRQTAYNWRKFGRQGTKLKATKTLKGFVTTEEWLREFLTNLS